MMNPSVYLQEAARIERQIDAYIHPKKLPSPVPVRFRGYFTERLPSGCILYTIGQQSKYPSPKGATKESMQGRESLEG
jgi:hypothetical protein